MRKTIFHKVEPLVYEYAATGYRVERMANGLWDAYLPSGNELVAYRLWESIHHSTRKSAAAAISQHRRWLSIEIAKATNTTITE